MAKKGKSVRNFTYLTHFMLAQQALWREYQFVKILILFQLGEIPNGNDRDFE